MTVCFRKTFDSWSILVSVSCLADVSQTRLCHYISVSTLEILCTATSPISWFVSGTFVLAYSGPSIFVPSYFFLASYVSIFLEVNPLNTYKCNFLDTFWALALFPIRGGKIKEPLCVWPSLALPGVTYYGSFGGWRPWPTRLSIFLSGYMKHLSKLYHLCCGLFLRVRSDFSLLIG